VKKLVIAVLYDYMKIMRQEKLSGA